MGQRCCCVTNLVSVWLCSNDKHLLLSACPILNYKNWCQFRELASRMKLLWDCSIAFSCLERSVQSFQRIYCEKLVQPRCPADELHSFTSWVTACVMFLFVCVRTLLRHRVSTPGTHLRVCP